MTLTRSERRWCYALLVFGNLVNLVLFVAMATGAQDGHAVFGMLWATFGIAAVGAILWKADE